MRLSSTYVLLSSAMVVWLAASSISTSVAWADGPEPEPEAEPEARADPLPAKETAGVMERGKLGKDGLGHQPRAFTPGKSKLCCGYPLSEEQGFKYTFYWMAEQDRHDDTRHWERLPARVLDFQGVGVDEEMVDIYTRQGHFIGSFQESFVNELRMEGSGWLSDGRVINYAGRCRYGVGTCFEVLEPDEYPYGRGAYRRPLVPFRSVAVDRKLVPIGETIYAPEFDGLRLPDGSVHDGCLRADDTGSAIKKKLIDFFVVELENFIWVNQEMWHDRYFTPHIEDPRCDYLLDSQRAIRRR